MTSEFKFFRVVLPNTVDTAAVGEGFVDDRNVESFGTLPASLANSLNKERANVRWEEILKALQESGSLGVSDIVKTGGTVDAAPTQIEFTVKYESEKVVWIHDLVTDPTGKTVYGPSSDLDIVGSTRNETFTNATEAAVIERAVATALSQPTFSDSREVIDPTTSGTPPAPRYVNTFQTVSVTQLGTGGTHALRMANIEGVAGLTVTQLDV